MRKWEAGQIAILLALAMAGLLAAVGLMGLNGPMLYFLQREGQNTVDAGAWSGMRICKGEDVVASAMKGVESNRRQGTYQSVRTLEDTLSDDGYVIHNIEIVARDITTISWWNKPLNNTFYVKVKMVVREPAIFPVALVTDLEVTVDATAKCWLDPQPYNTAIMGVSTSCNDPTTVNVSDGHITGNIYSGGDLRMASSNTVVDGYGEVVGKPQINPWVQFVPSYGNPATVSPYTGGAPVKLDDYAPGSEIANDAYAKGEYHYYDHNLHIVAGGNGDPTVLEDGLIFVDGDYTVTGDNWVVGGTGKRTVVATGGISFSASSVELRPYVNNPILGGLLLISGKTTGCGPTAISVSTADADWSGGVVAINGGVSFSSANNEGDGWIWGQTVKVSGSHFTLNETRPSASFDHRAIPVE